MRKQFTFQSGDIQMPTKEYVTNEKVLFTFQSGDIQIQTNKRIQRGR